MPKRVWYTFIATISLALFVYAATTVVLGPSIKGRIWLGGADENFGCKSQYPLAVTLSNRSFRRIARVAFDIELWLNGRTSSVLKDSSWRTFDKAVPAFSSETLCFTDNLFKEKWDAADEAKQSAKPTSARDLEGRNLLLESIQRVNHYNSWYLPLAENAEVNVSILHVLKK